MKHFEPLSMYLPLSDFFMKLVMEELSEPAFGSVRQNEASFGASTNGRRNLSFCSSDPCCAMTTFARSLHIADVDIPVSP